MFKPKFYLFYVFLMVGSSLSADSSTNLDLKEHVHNMLPEFPGWTTEEKADLIIDLVLEKNPSCYVEIGVFGGSSVFPALKAMEYLEKQGIPHGKVYAVDAWDSTAAIEGFPEKNPNTEWWSSVNLQDVYLQFNKLLSKHQLFSYCKILRGRSEKIVDQIPDTIDILHIDGNQSALGTIRDIKTYYPKVSIDGLIIVSNCLWVFDDEFSKDPGLDLLLDCCDFYDSCDAFNTIVFKKITELK